MSKLTKMKWKTCKVCAIQYTKGSFHHCSHGTIYDPLGRPMSADEYEQFMHTQDQVRRNKEARLQLEAAKAQAIAAMPTDPPDWPMITADPEVRWYINELHEMILDLRLRIDDLEEERV